MRGTRQHDAGHDDGAVWFRKGWCRNGRETPEHLGLANVNLL